MQVKLEGNMALFNYKSAQIILTYKKGNLKTHIMDIMEISIFCFLVHYLSNTIGS